MTAKVCVSLVILYPPLLCCVYHPFWLFFKWHSGESEFCTPHIMDLETSSVDLIISSKPWRKLDWVWMRPIKADFLYIIQMMGTTKFCIQWIFSWWKIIIQIFKWPSPLNGCEIVLKALQIQAQYIIHVFIPRRSRLLFHWPIIAQQVNVEVLKCSYRMILFLALVYQNPSLKTLTM